MACWTRAWIPRPSTGTSSSSSARPTTAPGLEADVAVDDVSRAGRGLRAGVDADPVAVADEIVRVPTLPVGAKPRRPVIDFTRSHVADVMVAELDDFVRLLSFGELLQAGAQPSTG